MPDENGTFTREEVESIRGQLQEELKTRDRAIQELQDRINSREQEVSILQGSRASQEEAHRKTLAQAQADLEVIKTERDALSTGLSAATAKYRTLLLTANPGIPEELVLGEDIEALDASLEKARGIVEKVRGAIQSQAQATPVPAGAPPRTDSETESLSPTEKIKFALRR